MAVIVYLHGGVHTALIMDPEIDSGMGLRWEEWEGSADDSLRLKMFIMPKAVLTHLSGPVELVRKEKI